jgi:hypothetical protein
MSDEPLTNAAVEWMRAGFRLLNEMERDEIVAAVTDDFVLDDRRSGVNFGPMDAAGIAEQMKSAWDVGSARPSWSVLEVIAVRVGASQRWPSPFTTATRCAAR